MRLRALTVFACLALFACSTGCRSAYYGFWEKFGYEKRDLLVSEVEDAKDGQEAAKKQFKTTLDRFKEITNFKGGDLEAKYRKLNSEYEACAARADAVSKQIKDVESVAKDLFTEWEAELKTYQSGDLRSKSEEQLRQTRSRYDQLIGAMKRSESRMPPVLAAFKDQVLFLKHNLNAAAIASLQGTAIKIDSDVARLVADMETSINEANAFIDGLK